MFPDGQPKAELASFAFKRLARMGWKSRMIPIPDSNADLLKQCDVHTFRASGKGGQHVNKTETAVRITHRETKIVLMFQDERSQHQNKRKCLNQLRNKLKAFNVRPLKRIPTRQPRSAKEEILREKKIQSTKKKLRQKPELDNEC